MFNFARNFNFKTAFDVIIKPKVTTNVKTIKAKIPVILVRYKKIGELSFLRIRKLISIKSNSKTIGLILVLVIIAKLYHGTILWAVSKTLGDRLTVGQQLLELFIGVRVPVPQPGIWQSARRVG